MQHAALLICNLSSQNEQMQKEISDLAKLNAMMRQSKSAGSVGKGHAQNQDECYN